MKTKLLKHFSLRATMLVLMVLAAINGAWAEESSLTFTKACGGSGTSDDGAEWTVSSDGAESNFDATSGIHYGTNKANVTYVQLETSDIAGTITSVVVNARDAQAKATISVTVGSVAFECSGSSTATNTSSNYTFTGSGTGKIIVRVDRGESKAKAIYVKSIVVTSESNLSDPELAFNSVNAVAVIGKDFTAPILTNNGDGAVTYESSNTSVATVDENTGVVTLVAAGETVIKATSAATSNYKKASAQYTLTVSSVALPAYQIYIEDFASDNSELHDSESSLQSQNLSGGTGNELLVKGSNGWFAVNINLLGYYGDLFVTFRSNHGDYLTLSSETSGVTIGERSTLSDKKYAQAITVPEGTTTLHLKLSNSNKSNARLDDFELRAETRSVNTASVGATGFATFSSIWPLDFSGISDIKAYIATADGETGVNFARINKVPANTGVLLVSADGGAVAATEVPYLTGDADATTGNVFVPGAGEAVVSTADGKANYILFDGTNGIGFYKANGQNVAKGKAYISVPAVAGVKSFFALPGLETAIKDIAVSEQAPIYNLAGQRVNRAQKGVFIQNGKKFIVK